MGSDHLVCCILIKCGTHSSLGRWAKTKLWGLGNVISSAPCKIGMECKTLLHCFFCDKQFSRGPKPLRSEGWERAFDAAYSFNYYYYYLVTY